MAKFKKKATKMILVSQILPGGSRRKVKSMTEDRTKKNEIKTRTQSIIALEWYPSLAITMNLQGFNWPYHLLTWDNSY